MNKFKVRIYMKKTDIEDRVKSISQAEILKLRYCVADLGWEERIMARIDEELGTRKYKNHIDTMCERQRTICVWGQFQEMKASLQRARVILDSVRMKSATHMELQVGQE